MQSKTPPAVGDPNQPIGWTLTGTLNSPSTNVAWHFSGGPGTTEPVSQSLDSLIDHNTPFDFNSMQSNGASFQQTQNSHTRTYSGNNLPHPSPHQQRHHRSSLPASAFATIAPSPTTFPSPIQHRHNHQDDSNSLHVPTFSQSNNLQIFDGAHAEESFGDFLIESQDVDMSLLGLDMLPWFDAPSGDLMPVFDEALNVGDVNTNMDAEFQGQDKNQGAGT
ncbi:hypothetical protein KCU73_g11810, partial [Aureobasidium melanogenum]